MHSLEEQINYMRNEVKLQRTVVERLRKALEAIIKIEDGCKQRNVGYDIEVHNIAKRALYRD